MQINQINQINAQQHGQGRRPVQRQSGHANDAMLQKVVSSSLQ